MSDTERAECRAQGALDNFLIAMRKEMVDKQRSPEYQETFFESLKDTMADFIFKDKT